MCRSLLFSRQWVQLNRDYNKDDDCRKIRPSRLSEEQGSIGVNWSALIHRYLAKDRALPRVKAGMIGEVDYGYLIGCR
jgi:hypothetical protein